MPIYIIVQCEKAFLIQVIIMSKQSKTNLTGWHRNTDLGCDLKTILCSDRRAKSGKGYQGILRRDVECDEFLYDEHFTFTEIVPQAPQKRNPHVYDGEFITVTRRSDGSYHPNFKPLKVDKNFSVERYISGVDLELHKGLEGLVGKR